MMHSRVSTAIPLRPTRRLSLLVTQTYPSSIPFIRKPYSTTKRSVHLSSAAAPSLPHGQFQRHDEPLSPPDRPLKRLPTLMLLRSLLIATVTSHRALLLPTLSLLKLLTRPHTSKLFSVDKNPVLHGILKKTFYNQFCAGENGAETRECVRSLKKVGFRGVILTYARETVFDHKTQSAHAVLGAHQQEAAATASAEPQAKDVFIENWKDGVLETAAWIDAGDLVALKLTGAGPRVTSALAADLDPPEELMDALRVIASDCKRRGVRVIVDAESQHYQKSIDRTSLQLMREFNRDGEAVVYNTYQAYLKSTPANVAAHLLAAKEGEFTLGLKVVRGAYMLSDDRALIHDTKQDTDNAYNSIVQGALRREFGELGGLQGKHPFPSVNLFIASHNRESVHSAYKLHRQRTDAGLPTVPVSYGQLQGMADKVSFGLLEEGERDSIKQGDGATMKMGESNHTGPDVFKCTTWGSMSECIAYLLRRAAENRDAVLRTKDEYDSLRSEVWRRLFFRT